MVKRKLFTSRDFQAGEKEKDEKTERTLGLFGQKNTKYKN